MIKRDRHVREVLRRLDNNPVVAIIGARQVGKTTLAGIIGKEFKGDITTFDLEDHRDLSRLSEPQLALDPLKGLVILDEIQRAPEIFPLLRVLADRPRQPARFLVLGSASPDLLRQSSESLAGRISYYELPGFQLHEISAGQESDLWLRGGFPRSFLASDILASNAWRIDFIRTYLERDLPGLGIHLPPGTLRRFWTMAAHSHGQIWNSSRLAGSMGVAHTTARSYLDVLCDTFMARQLQPFIANTGKRQVKSPKVYIRDSGLLHALLGIEEHDQLAGHPIIGASWEGFAMEQIIGSLGVDMRRCYFWAVHTGAELDLVIERGNKLVGFEFKRTLSPEVTPSMRSAIDTLELDSLSVIYPGSEEFSLSAKVTAMPLSAFI